MMSRSPEMLFPLYLRYGIKMGVAFRLLANLLLSDLEGVESKTHGKNNAPS